MLEEPKQKPSCLERRARMGVPPYGNGWPGVKARWCTGQLKTHLMDKEVNRLKKEKNAVHCIGIAADEAHRCKDDPHKRYPLVKWGITEAQALQICYDRGFDFGGQEQTKGERRTPPRDYRRSQVQPRKAVTDNSLSPASPLCRAAERIYDGKR